MRWESCRTRPSERQVMRLLTDSEEEGLLDLLVPGFGRLRGTEAGRVRRRCVRMILTGKRRWIFTSGEADGGQD